MDAASGLLQMSKSSAMVPNGDAGSSRGFEEVLNNYQDEMTSMSFESAFRAMSIGNQQLLKNGVMKVTVPEDDTGRTYTEKGQLVVKTIECMMSNEIYRKTLEACCEHISGNRLQMSIDWLGTSYHYPHLPHPLALA